ncbi:hypothetical protein IKE67_05550 [bacterium]|nr:hypothetical protein [bacterium]
MIKKLAILFLCLFTFSLNVNASEISSMCAQPHDLSWTGTKILTNVTGMTFLSQAIANSIVKKELRKSMGSKDFKVKMKSFSAKDLADGRFKSLDINGKNLNLDGIYLSEFSASTICDFNYVKATTKTVSFKENFGMNYSMKLTEADLKKTILSENYIKLLKSINLKMGDINLLELKNVDVNLKDDKFLFALNLQNTVFNYSIPFNINAAAKMKVQNGQIQASEITMLNKNKTVNLTQITNIINMINPLKFTANILDNSNAQVAIKTLDIKGDKLTLDGTLFIPKNTEESRK